MHLIGMVLNQKHRIESLEGYFPVPSVPLVQVLTAVLNSPVPKRICLGLDIDDSGYDNDIEASIKPSRSRSPTVPIQHILLELIHKENTVDLAKNLVGSIPLPHNIATKVVIKRNRKLLEYVFHHGAPLGTAAIECVRHWWIAGFEICMVYFGRQGVLDSCKKIESRDKTVAVMEDWMTSGVLFSRIAGGLPGNVV